MDGGNEVQERARLLQNYLDTLRKEVEHEKENLVREREASTEELKGAAHLPTCPMSDLADIDPACIIHGHLSAQWKSLTSIRDDRKTRGWQTMRRDDTERVEAQGAKGDEDVEWMDFANDYSTMSLTTVPPMLDISSAELKRLPSPPPETFLAASQSYMTKLNEVDDMCKEEMSRVYAFVPNLDQLNQLASDWDVKAANSPDFSRLNDESTLSYAPENGDDETTLDGPMPEHLRNQLDSIEDFISALVM